MMFSCRTTEAPKPVILYIINRKFNLIVIPTPVWVVGFAHEQSLHVVALACSASRKFKTNLSGLFYFNYTVTQLAPTKTKYILVNCAVTDSVN
ncbi:MAG: hypothetical protein LBJ00_15985 [Planctomycetaceae bacterium]|nr:hypothetical protein [Planctomycetaceae bacterium]